MLVSSRREVRPQNQRGFGGAGISALVVVVGIIMSLVMSWIQIQTHKVEAEGFVKIAKSQLKVIDGLESHFFVDCHDDGIVATPSLSLLISTGYVSGASIYNPYGFSYTLDINRPNTSFDVAGRVVAQGSTNFTLSTTITDERHRGLMKRAYKVLGKPYMFSGTTVSISRELALSAEDRKNLYINDGVGYSCR